ncbi:MAG: hypothetical protein SOV58_04410 [Candidatus Enteromonas sp.]|nr:hypothetical protein [Candidatus Enteromonas sp.]
MKFTRTLSAAFLAAVTLGLASCEVEMDLPSADREANIINNAGDIFANNLGDLYDSVVTSGDTNSEKILNNILYSYAKVYFGDFYADYNTDGTLKDGKKPIAFTKDGVVDAVKAKNFFHSILDSIAKSFWSVVNNTSYQKDKMFDEEKFVKAQRNELLSFPTDTSPTYIKKQVKGIYTYQDFGLFFQGEGNVETFRKFYKEYIERSLLPNAYRKALVEKYLIDNNYGTLGRSYARKVQYIALPNLEKFEDSTRSLVRSYCEHVLSSSTVDAKYKDLSFLNELYQGIADSTDPVVQSVYAGAGFTAVTANGENVYRETSYGQLLIDYDDLNSSRWETGTSTDFTNGGTYTPATGLEMKKRDIYASSKVTSGWYTSSGLSDLPSAMKTRLFKNQVANEVDNPTNNSDINVMVKDKFTWRVQGEYYLRPETIQTGEQYPYAMYDDSGKTWYIVRIDEAVKSGKMAVGNEDSESYRYESRPADGSKGETLDQITWKVADLLADGDSYKKAARQYFVEQMQMSFHDDQIYSYFENAFPDLFD